MSPQDLNYEQPTVSDAAVDNSDDYTEYTFSTTKGMRFALIVTYIQYTILAKNDCMEVKTFPKKANKMPQRNPMARCGRPKPLYFKGNTA